MKFATVSSLVGASLLAGSTVAQQAFETSDFNATDELLHLGVDVSEIPELADFVEKRSLDKYACSAAVSRYGPRSGCVASAMATQIPGRDSAC